MIQEQPPKVAIQPLDCIGRGKDLVAPQYWLMVGITFVATLIASALPVILQGPMYCGLYLCLSDLQRGERIPFERVFKGFDVFLESLVATLLCVVISLAICLPFVFTVLGLFVGGAAAMEERNEGLGVLLFVLAGGTTLVFVFVSIALSVLFAFLYPLIMDRRVSALEALRLSVTAGARNFWGLTGLVLVNGLILVALSLLCVIPIYFYLPIWFAANWVAYRKVFPALPQDAPEEARDVVAEGGYESPGIA